MQTAHRTALVLIAIGTLCPALALAAGAQEAEAAYCGYVTEQATAERNLLRAPSVFIGAQRPSTGTPPYAVLGVSSSVADLRKASLTIGAARAECELYRTKTEAEKHVAYAAAFLEREILRHRLDLIQRATNQLDEMIANDLKRVTAQNLTRTAVYHLQSSRARLTVSRASVLSTMASPHIPPLSSVPLRTLIDDKEKAEVARQKALNRLLKQNAWDIEMSAGAYRQIGRASFPTTELGPFGTVNVTYNLARQSAARRLDASLDAFSVWKTQHHEDVTQKLEALRRQIEETIAIQQDQLALLIACDTQIGDELAAVQDVESGTALSYRNQLLADRVVLQVDIGDAQFRVTRLRQYLTENF